ncbi:four helix bundle protein [Rufibacter glacialis]|nr:four helix bundle protein [Rufibacter glacialis]
MKEENVLLTKSYSFAVRIIKLYQFLTEEKKDYTIGKQILRSGTSIGSNAEEAMGGQSDRDFVNKLSISYKEARETHYWLRLLRDTGYLTKELAFSLLNDCEELLKIIGSILRTMKGKGDSNS